ncbi:hypothetical protein EMIT0P253_20279 [Pseudomonas sp. IT-P253]|jgi:hypothetical protein
MVSADLMETIASSVGLRKGVLPGRIRRKQTITRSISQGLSNCRFKHRLGCIMQELSVSAYDMLEIKPQKSLEVGGKAAPLRRDAFQPWAANQ